MTKIQKTKCNEIIEKYKSMVHTHNSFSGFAVKSLVGVSVDISTVSAMIIELANICGLSISENEADVFFNCSTKKNSNRKTYTNFYHGKSKKSSCFEKDFFSYDKCCNAEKYSLEGCRLSG